MNLSLTDCTKSNLDTPALCIDLEAMESNIQSVMATCRQHGVEWRPHTKCHKSPVIAQKLIEAGAIGMTCAKLGEAEVMAAGGIRDLLIANLIVGDQKIARLVELRRIADPIVCIDHIDQAKPISAAMNKAGLKLRVILELNIGLDRVGVAPGDATLALAQQVAALPGIEFAGIMGYEGHLLQVADLSEKEKRIREALDILAENKSALETSGIPCPIVSCGGTGSYVFAVTHPGITELQAGGAIFMDDYYRNQCQVPDLGFALTVVATVVSRPAPERAIIDAGRKTMYPDLVMPRVLNCSGVTVSSLSAEHGSLLLDENSQSLKIGDRIELLPGYSDMTCVLHDHFFAFRGYRLYSIVSLAGRGKLQ